MTPTETQIVHYLPRPGGRIAYTLHGSGPLVVAVPGMGDIRSSYRELVRPLVDGGYRVAVTDLRGHGDSDATFTELGDVPTGQDLLALIDELEGNAVVIGNSMGAAAATWAAAERPDAVRGLVLYGPLLREAKATASARRVNRLLYKLIFARPWGTAFWCRYYRSGLNRGQQAPWLAEHVAAIHAALTRPGRLASFRSLALALDHSVVEARLPEVMAPMKAFIGSLDPDYPSPRGEVEWLVHRGADAELVDDCGHYPHAQRPKIVVPATLAFLAPLRSGGGWRA